MAISVTEILGTDSLSGSRLVINDNFAILASEINSMENFFNPTLGTLQGLNDVRTQSLRVGLTTVLLDINASTFNILTSINVNNGNIKLNGGNLIRNNVDPNTLNDVHVGPSLNTQLGTSTAPPPYTIERVGCVNGSTLTVLVNTGLIGQELFIVYSQATTGNVDIKGAVVGLILPGGGATPTVRLNTLGASAHLLCIDDGTGNGLWTLVGGAGYSIS
jgi:hypothetical protein